MASSSTPGMRSYARRDELLRIQKQAQRRWEEARVFEADAPPARPPFEGEKFFGNFPYPYMNGVLHLGHAFSLSKLEFASAYYRLRGRNVLLPFGFHCTGMPIKACADKLDREIRQFGNPPLFPCDDGQMREDSVADAVSPDANFLPEGEETAEPEKFKSKKSKAAAKTGTAKYQWEILQSLGLPDHEVSNFRDPLYWLNYFPPIAIRDLKDFGLGCDWRRSFITTDVNPYYDSFVRWQLRKLKNEGKVVKDKRYTIYSPLDGQPCADHDRASGEGVLPQEYTLIKMQVQPPFTGKLKALEGKQVFLAAATLRPETMYGQTNAWVLPDGHYGAFEINDIDVFVVTRRAALNLAFQQLSKIPEKPTCLLEMTGYELIGIPLRSPLTCNEIVYALPMLTILTDKGTGIVTSVPSDSPDDYMALKNLKMKPALRAKYGVQDEWVLPFEVIPIINITEFGDKSAEKVCNDLKIKSPNEKDKLAEAKRLTYLKGFTEGTMLVGEYKGVKVQDAKPLIREALLKTGQAVKYSEPEKKVMSRSGDECVVALTDQWYLMYGEPVWKAKAIECLAGMELYNDETRHGFENTLGWPNQWACSRSFGLGTRLPWDEQFLVESLSDSTIYMAYYAVSHILQSGDVYGRSKGSIKVEQLTDEVWDYIFCDGCFPKTDIPDGLLRQLKQEFDYWYPFDVRVSGKDLIQNHLTFCIYNHTAIFHPQKWPRAFRCNGMLMLNSEKMSKSTGNFCTLKQAIEEFSSDATRFALADSGDTMDDANFVYETANSAILRLTKEIVWMKELFESEHLLRQGPPTTFADRAFENEINIAIHFTEKNYNMMMFREALKSGFYDLQTARDEYRLSCGSAGMNRNLLWRFMDVQTRLLTPICPHYAEHVWMEVLKNEGFAIKAGWPAASTPDWTLMRANQYLQDSIITFRKILQKQMTSSKNIRNAEMDCVSPTPAVGFIFVAEQYDGWKDECLKILRTKYDKNIRAFAPDQEILSALMSSSVARMTDAKQVIKQCMPFIKFKKNETLTVGPQVLDTKLPFGEIQLLEENLDRIKRQLGLDVVSIFSFTDLETVDKLGSHVSVLKQNPPSPGAPVLVFVPSSEALEKGILQNGEINSLNSKIPS